jgi:hypothetical protein
LDNVRTHQKICIHRVGDDGKPGYVRYSTNGLSIQEIINAYVNGRLAVSWNSPGQTLKECARLTRSLRKFKKAGNSETTRARETYKTAVPRKSNTKPAKTTKVQRVKAKKGQVELKKVEVKIEADLTIPTPTDDLRRQAYLELLDQGYGSADENS